MGEGGEKVSNGVATIEGKASTNDCFGVSDRLGAIYRDRPFMAQSASYMMHCVYLQSRP